MTLIRRALLGTFLSVFLLSSLASTSAAEFETDTVPTSMGELRMTFIAHGTLMLECAGTVIHVDPVSRYADYTKQPKADIILVTHEHGDHLDKAAIGNISQKGTVLILTKSCAQKLSSGTVMNNGDTKSVKGLKIEAVPAYNVVQMRQPGQPFHPKGVGNGYVITFGDTRVYVAGDTEETPDMKKLANITIAFLPMNLPYTMTPAMVATAAKSMKPKVLYPYHFGKTDTSELVRLLKGTGIEVRIRKLQ